MVPYDRLAYREAHAGATARLLGREKGIEDSRRVLRRHTVSGVQKINRDRGRVVGGSPGSYIESPAFRGHSIKRVHDEVDADLLKLAGIAFDHQRLIAERGRDLDVTTRCLGFHQAERMIDDRTGIANRSLRFTPASVIEQHADDTRDPVDLTDDDLESFASFGGSAFAVQQIFRATANHPHWGSNLVGEAGREGTDGCQPFGMLQPAFEVKFPAMFQQQFPARIVELVVKTAKLFGEEAHFITVEGAIAEFGIGEAGDPP